LLVILLALGDQVEVFLLELREDVHECFGVLQWQRVLRVIVVQLEQVSQLLRELELCLLAVSLFSCYALLMAASLMLEAFRRFLILKLLMLFLMLEPLPLLFTLFVTHLFV
jgi:hypothetical protein